MTRHADVSRTTTALRALDPAGETTLSEEERRRADAVLARIVATPADEHVRPRTGERRRRRRVLVPAALLAAGVVTLSTVLGGGAAFADWTATPTPLPPSSAAAAAATCRAGMGIPGDPRVVIAERRGGWTYVLLDAASGEGACLMPDDLVGARGDEARGRSFGSYDAERIEPPTPTRDGLVETESMTGTVSVPRRLGLSKVDGVFAWVTGYAGSDVTQVTVDPPVGPDSVATLVDGRFAAWWPLGAARGGAPGLDGAWTYTVTLTDGTTRQVRAR